MNIDGIYLLDVEPFERSCKFTVDRERDKGVNLIYVAYVPYAREIERPMENKRKHLSHKDERKIWYKILTTKNLTLDDDNK